MSISKKLACGVIAAGAPLAAAGALALASSPAAASSSKGLPVLTVNMNGSAITVGGSQVSGAVTVRSTVTTENHGTAILVRLNKGVTQAQFLKALQMASKDPNAVQLVGAIVFDSTTAKGQTSNVQTVLAPDRYVAIDVAGKGQPRRSRSSRSQSRLRRRSCRRRLRRRSRSSLAFAARARLRTTSSCAESTTAGWCT